jgi:intracellular multiplication protein IcmX
MYDTLIPYNVMGTPLPNPTEYFSTACTANVIPQVNVSTLMAPLQYSTSSASQSSTSSSSSSSSSSCSTQTQLNPTSQAENAYLFTKYALNDFLQPSGRPSYSAYQTAYSNATATASSTTSSVTIAQNYAGIVQYFMQLRNYAAGSSVAHDNLYQILSKRMPQSSGSNSTSQALSEFQMATARLYNPTGNGTSQWLQGINEASPATVQKEMAALLAEINYQLYLMRQTEERELLTLSIMLMTQLNQTAPNFSQIMQNATQQSSS